VRCSIPPAGERLISSGTSRLESSLQLVVDSTSRPEPDCSVSGLSAIDSRARLPGGFVSKAVNVDIKEDFRVAIWAYILTLSLKRPPMANTISIIVVGEQIGNLAQFKRSNVPTHHCHDYHLCHGAAAA